MRPPAKGDTPVRKALMRTPGSRRDTTWPLIRAAGIDLLYEFGYENMNTRQLATSVGLKPGSLYYYFNSKEELLHQLVMELLQDIVDDLEKRLDGVDNATTRLSVFIETLVKWHVDNHKESYIARMEVRSLSPDKHETYMFLRDRFDSRLDDILLQGHTDGVFREDPDHLTRISVLTMITGITGWYRPMGGAGTPRLTEYYTDLVFRMVSQTPPTD